MKYTTRYYGAPYGIDGERGEDTTAPLTQARATLQVGQHMDCYRRTDTAQTTAIRRYVSGEAGVTEIIL